MRRALGLTLAGALLARLAAGAAPAPQDRLNLLLVTADDLNGDSVGWMGDPQGATPNLDRFAATAHRFVNHYLVAPLCQPSRSALMTGLAPQRNGATSFNPVFEGTPTLVTLLRAAGYYSAVLNKSAHMQPPSAFPWDANFERSSRDPKIWSEMLATALDAAAKAGKPFFVNANIRDPHRPFRLGPVPAPHPGTPLEAHPEHELSMSAAEAAAVPVRRFDPEALRVPRFLADLPEVREDLAQYYSAVARLDEAFQEIFHTLRESGHLEDTVVVFLGDNGMPFPFAKGTLFRSGTHEPVLLRWPGMGVPQVRPELVSSLDLLPTLLDLLDVKPPGDLDGRSWLPMLRGEPAGGHDAVFAEVNQFVSGGAYPQRSVRTLRSALLYNAWSNGVRRLRFEATRTPSYRAMEAAATEGSREAERLRQFDAPDPLVFFDLEEDPDELVNRIHDPRSRPEIERLAKLLVAEMRRTSDPKLPAFEQALAETLTARAR